LVQRNWPGEIECKLRGLVETIDHIIFRCTIASFVWCVCRDALGWQHVPVGVENFESFVWCADKHSRDLLIFLFGCIAWSLWLEMTLFGVYRMMSFMQRWVILCRTEDRQRVEEVLIRLKLRLSALPHQFEGDVRAG
ncbi:hypothetical protein BAE44_0003241, partial [Dichanthelium oligosanthes]